MKKIITIITGLIVGVSVNAQSVNDTVAMGKFYANQVFYSLDNGEVANVSNTDWELGFSVDGRGAAGSAIIINEATTSLWTFDGDITDWNNFDTTGYAANWERLLNTDTSWTNGAFNVHRGAAGVFDMGWGVLNPQQNYWTFGDSLYLAKLSDGSFRKIWVVSLKTGVWEYKYANVDGSNEQTFTIDKSNYPNKNFVYHSMLTDQIIDREPDNTTWDLMFAKHTDYIAPNPMFPAGLYQSVTSVFNNKKVWSAKANEVDYNAAIASTAPQTTFNQNIINIGREWKKYSSATGWTVYDSIAYFVYDNDSTDFYRIVFNGFESGFSGLGKAMFNKEHLQTVSVQAYQQNVSFSMYPNPATNQLTLLLDYFESATMNIEILDLSGRTVMNKMIRLNNGVNQKTINISQLTSGIYLMNLRNDNFSTTQKLIVR